MSPPPRTSPELPTPLRDSLRKISRSHRIALTTVAGTDLEYCDRLQTSLVRGSHELLYWGVGPKMRRGDIVALYTPESIHLPQSEHKCVRRLYFVAADSTKGSPWNQHVFLHRRVNLDRPISYKTLIDKVGLPFRDIVNAGTRKEPMTENVAVEFLAAVAEACNDGLTRVREMARGAKTSPELCISYSGDDWTQAHRVKVWFEAAGIRPFFVSPVGLVLPIEEKPLREFLNGTFSAASVVVCLVPPGILSEWVQLEVKAALSAKRVIFVRPDDRRPWPAMARGKNVVRFTLRRAEEGELVDLVKKQLVAAAAPAHAD